MFVGKKHNSRTVISVQVKDKSMGKYVVKKTIGSSKDEHRVEPFLESEIFLTFRLFYYKGI
jgi:hypothetical protein